MPYLEIEANELLHHVGARAAVMVTPEHPGSIPFTIGPVSHQPEAGAILVDALIPGGTLQLQLSPSTILQVAQPDEAPIQNWWSI
ncbi:hypothetical protein [Agreia sp. COWG]|uniref:hypothetical protein n=1 Tax=Agreia sp. COWG TaxID=2773266 RepID=UPI001928B33B|nr:hypothetical protein [Agreia sp. COWG]CAD5999405.1 protein of unknown function [Agreia sp. COWG]